jgi:flagellar hook protein FlgE
MMQQKGVFMTISSSMNAGVSGLTANASQLASISDNIANSSTYGYKRVETDFNSMVNGSPGGAYSAGGTIASTTRLVDQRGALISTSNPTDLAVNGRGMLPVTTQTEVANGTEQMMLTTTASFRPDAEGYLTTESGLVLMGWPALPDGSIPDYPRDTSAGLEPVQINLNQISGQPTTEIALALNLPAEETSTTADAIPQQLSVEYFDNIGTPQSLQIDFVPTTGSTGLSNEWTMTITDSASGTAVGEYVMTFDDSRDSGGNLASVTTVSGGAYDPLTGSVIINVEGGPIEVGIGALGSSQGITQFSGQFTPISVSKDGSPVGNVTSVEVDASGYVYALFDTGISQVFYQIPLVDMPNVNGMTALDNQTYLPSPDAGTFFLWEAGEGPTGSIVAYAREESTTDVATELTSMIRTQRAYSSNAKVIQTVDEMWQETTNIKR